MTILSFSKTVHQWHLAFNTVQLLQCKSLNFLLSYGPVTLQSLNPLTV